MGMRFSKPAWFGALVIGVVNGLMPAAAAAADGPGVRRAPPSMSLAVSVSDLDRSANFYKALGFEADPPAPFPAMLGKLIDAGDSPKGRMEALYRNGVKVNLVQLDSPTPKGKPSQGIASALGLAQIGLHVDDVDRVIPIIKQNGGTVFEQNRLKISAPGISEDVVICADPDGVRLEIVGPVKSLP
jgi:catechol 2,3-dioxygenase-like lactoylglutathione lyase family enzyme